MAGIPAYIHTLARCFEKAGHPLYGVGGAVRAQVLGLPPADYDVTGPATPDEAMAVIKNTPGFSARMVLPRLGTIHIAHEDGAVEYTTFRTESYGDGHTPREVAFTTDINKDALRRDFSCNALYLDLCSGQIHDPTGGLQDIEKKLLRATTADPALIMKDDGLRVLRMVRFALQLRFTIEEKTYQSADAALLTQISKERLGQELSQILLGDVRYDVPYGWAALVRGLYQLDELGVRQILFPHCVVDDMACAEAPPHLPSRLAAWLLPSGSQKAKVALEELRFSGDVVNQAVQLIEDLLTEGDFAWKLVRRGYAHGERLAALKPALAPLLAQLQADQVPDSLARLAVTGEDVANLLGGPSTKVGETLTALWQHVVGKPADNQRETLLKLAQEYN